MIKFQNSSTPSESKRRSSQRIKLVIDHYAADPSDPRFEIIFDSVKSETSDIYKKYFGVTYTV